MSKRQLFIIIAILVVLDIAAGFWYLAGHINADGNGAVLFDSSDEAVEAADTVAGNSKPDHFETMAAHAYYVSRQPVEEEDASTYLSCIKRFKGRIKSTTKCTSHFVREITAAKPKAEQIAIIKLPLVMDLSNCWKAIMGFIDTMAKRKPAVRRTRRVS